jgi:hypothetical protein
VTASIAPELNGTCAGYVRREEWIGGQIGARSAYLSAPDRAHAGQVAVESSPEHDSTFWFKLPRVLRL